MLILEIEGSLVNFKAPLDHSYTKPIVKIIKNRITIQNPIVEISYKDTANGNKNKTSRSNTINKIATR
jgi:hypothetical protein